MPARTTITYQDHSREKATVSVEGIDLTAANFDAQAAAVNALANAIQGITLGAEVQLVMGNVGAGTLVPPTNPAAQRENKWLVSYVDSGNPTRTLNSEVPCADITDEDLRLPNSDEADLDHADMAAFVAAFEAYVRAPFTGNAVEVQKIIYVGRRT